MCHMGSVTQFYLPPDRGDVPVITPTKVGTRFVDPRGTKGWIEQKSVAGTRPDDEPSMLPHEQPRHYWHFMLQGQLIQTFNFVPTHSLLVPVHCLCTNIRTEYFVLTRFKAIYIKANLRPHLTFWFGVEKFSVMANWNFVTTARFFDLYHETVCCCRVLSLPIVFVDLIIISSTTLKYPVRKSLYTYM